MKSTIALPLVILLGSLAGASQAATASGVNHPPVCPAKVLDMHGIPAGADLTSLDIDIINVAPICTDPDGDQLTVTKVTSLGVANAIGAPMMKATMKAGDSRVIVFTVSDGKGGTVTSTLTIKR